MSKSQQDKVLETINNRIDGLDLLKLINYRTDTIQEMGTTIKCFCPIHKERVFKSLLLDNKKKSIKCAFKSCRGFDGGTFIDLYALLFNLSTYNAAIEISKKLNLNIDTNIFSLATSELFQSAKKLYEDGKIEEAIKKCIEARDMDASNLDTTKLLIAAYRSLNRKEDIAREYLSLSKSLQNKNDYSTAIATLKELSEIDLENTNALLELANIYEKLDNREEVINTYKKIISIYTNKNQFNEAIDIYKKVLKKDEGLLDFRLELATIYEKINDIKSAIKEYEKIAKRYKYNGELEKEKSIYHKILPLQEDNESIKLALADVSLRLNETEQAKNIFKDLADSLYNSVDTSLRNKKEVSAFTSILEKAKDYYKRVIEINENDIDSLHKLSSVYDLLKESKKALEINKKLLEHYQQTADWQKVAELASSVVEQEGDNLSAKEILARSLIKTDKINEGVDELLNLANILLDNKQEEKAIQLFDEALKIKPDDIELRKRVTEYYLKSYVGDGSPQLVTGQLLNLSKTYLESEDFATAQECIEKILTVGTEHCSVPTYISALELALSISEKQHNSEDVISKALKLADLFSSQNNTNMTRVYLDKALNYDPQNTEILEKLSELYIKDGEIEKAIEILRSLIKNYEKEKQTDKLIIAIEKLFEIAPVGDAYMRPLQKTELKEKLIDLYLSKEESEKALKEIAALANIYIQGEHFPEAEKLLLQGHQLAKNNEELLKLFLKLYDCWKKDNQFIEYANKLANIYLSKEEDQKAAELFDTVLAKDPENLMTLDLQAKIFEKMGKKEESLKILKSLATIYQKKKDLNKAAEILKQIIEHQPENPEILEELSELYIKTGNTPDALEFMNRAGSLYISQNKFDKALPIYKKARKLEPKNLEIIRKLAELNKTLGNLGDAEKDYKHLAKELEGKNNLEEALEVYRKILQFNKGDCETREKEASILYNLGEIYEAMNKYVELIKELDEKGQTSEAIKLCKSAIAKDEGRSTLYETLAYLYKKLNDYKKYEETLRNNAQIEILNKNYSKAEKVLLSILEIAEDDLDTLMQLAMVETELKQLDSAKNHYKMICNKALEKGDEDKAVEAINKAVALTPDDNSLTQFAIDLKLTLGRFDEAKRLSFHLIKKLLDVGELEESQKILSALKEKAPDLTAIHNEIATLFIENEIPELAYSEYLELALLKKEEDVAAGKEACRKGLEIRPNGIELRKVYIKLLKSCNDLDALHKELELLGANLENASLSEDAVEIYREMLSIKFDDSLPHKRLLSLYDKLNQPDNLKDELRTLGEIEIDRENFADAVNVFKRLIELEPDDIRVRKRYIEASSKIRPEKELINDYLKLAQGYLKENVVQEAIWIYKKILGLAPENIEAQENLSNLLLKEKNLAESKQAVLDYTRILANKGETKKVIEKLKQLCEYIPDDIDILKLLVDSYLKINARGMASETLGKIINIYSLTGDYDRAIYACEEKLNIDPFDKETRGKLVDFYLKTKKKDEAIEEMMKQADLYIKQKLLDLAEAEYKKILHIDPKNITVRNYLIDTHLQMGLEEDMIEEYRSLAEVYMEKGHINNALKTYKKIIEITPKDIDARIKYTDAYLQVGLEEDLLDDYVELAKLFSEMGMTKEAAELYKKVGLLSPGTTKEKPVWERPAKSLKKEEGQTKERTIASAQPIDEIISNYKSILRMNKENTKIRLKLAELYESKGMLKESLEEYKKTSETFFKKGELNDCIKLCERLMEKDPTDIYIRDRLQKAILRRDSLKALDSAIEAQTDLSKIKKKEKKEKK